MRDAWSKQLNTASFVKNKHMQMQRESSFPFFPCALKSVQKKQNKKTSSPTLRVLASKSHCTLLHLALSPSQ